MTNSIFDDFPIEEKVMSIRLMSFALLLTVFTSASAFGDPPTKAQRAELNKLIESGAISGGDLEAFLAAHRPAKTDEPITAVADGSHKMEVDYGLPLPKALTVGKYEWVNADITVANFPATRKGKAAVEIIFVRVGREVATEKILADLSRMGLRPATLPELLALGSAHASVHRTLKIVALGSSLNRPGVGVGYPVLHMDDESRLLHLNWDDPDKKWDADLHFAAVRK